ncbi:N-acetyltransferase [Roseovarius sp. C7]|uniref:N-acetyltransferase n=1 Tax=Roseovarius sp. C7 TaxID=3398643 RepID=UPI0039F6BD88
MAFGILGQTAPELTPSDWIDAKGATAPFRLADHTGQVVVLFFFQAWCPSCHSRGFPTLQTLMADLAEDARVAFAAVQTVFEGFSENGPERRAEMLDDYDLDLPVAQDEGQRPATIAAYRTGGTPWVVIIGPDGRVAFNDYHIDPARALRLIADLAEGRRHAPDPQEDVLHHEAAQNRFVVAFHDGGTGRVDYARRGRVLDLLHSEVPAARRGQGLGGRLMERVLEAVEAEGLQVRPVCSYTAAYLRRYKRWAHLLA